MKHTNLSEPNKPLSNDETQRKLLVTHEAKVGVSSWNVRDGVHYPSSYLMETKDGKFEKRVKWDNGRWRKWHQKQLSDSRFDGFWRLCGPKQESILSQLFAAAVHCDVVVDRYKEPQK